MLIIAIFHNLESNGLDNLILLSHTKQRILMLLRIKTLVKSAGLLLFKSKSISLHHQFLADYLNYMSFQLGIILIQKTDDA